MSEKGSIDENVTGNSSENVKGSASEIHTLTHVVGNEQIKGFNSPQTRQPEELTRLGQEMVTTTHPSYYPRVVFANTFVQPHIIPTARYRTRLSTLKIFIF